MSLNGVNLITKPIMDTMHAADLPNAKTLAVIMKQATECTHAAVAVAILMQHDGHYIVNVAVQYEQAGKWYKKEGASLFDLRNALKTAYRLVRKHYKVTASRTFAGLLHDSVVPATEDIDC